MEYKYHSLQKPRYVEKSLRHTTMPLTKQDKSWAILKINA